ncbi:MAG: hypothetical protein R2790_03860 [Flavobacterium haoranii]
MKTFKHISRSLIISIGIVMFFNACKKNSKTENPILEVISEDINNKVNTQFLTDVTNLNLKVVNVTKLAKTNELELPTKSIIKDIESDHLEMNKKLKKIARENLIIIPDTIYDYNEQIDTLNSNRGYVYLVELEKLLQQEITEFELIQENTKSKEIESLAFESIKDLKEKLTDINEFLK